MTALTRTATYRARPDLGDQLADRLLHSAALIEDASGCELWLVHRDGADPDTVRVTEMWASQENCEAAFEVDGVAASVDEVLELLDGAPEVSDGTPLGGARMLRGVTGAKVFRILDAPDLSQDTELLGAYDLDSVGEARYVREYLGARAIGLTHYRLRSGRRQGWAHRHGISEEIYVALSGNGRLKVDDELLDLDPLDAVWIAPGSVRELEAGPDGLEILAIGSHFPGDGEMVADWWPG